MGGRIRLSRDFKEFIESLNDNHVRYLLVGGVDLNLIDLENLKKSKRIAGRHQDLADLENLK